MKYEEELINAINRAEGILRLHPAWVARSWLSPGRRLALPDDAYDLGERGAICERWLASTTLADNAVGPDDEGLSYVNWDGPRVTLKELVQLVPTAVMGERYAREHVGLDRLAKIFDYTERLPYHIHPRKEHSELVGRNSKDEAYYFPHGVSMGAHPETFLGVHPYLGKPEHRETLLPYLVEWKDDAILKHAPAYLQVADEGFYVPSGILHAPGTALTIELQEDSDTLAMFQAMNGGKIISKDLLYKDVRPEDKEKYGERFLLEWVDWPANADPFFYENHRLTSQAVPGSVQDSGDEKWILYGTTKFSGKRLTVKPCQSYVSQDKGVYSLLVWRGRGQIGGVPVEGQNPGLDELLITYDRATAPLKIENTGHEDLVIIKFFGPDINNDAPKIASVK